MATYRYTALDANGREKKGQIEAADTAEAARLLREKGLFPMDVSAQTRTKAKPPKRPSGKRRKLRPSAVVIGTPRMSSKQLTEFTRRLATLLEAGMPIVRSLRTLEDQYDDFIAKKVIGNVAGWVESGEMLSEALAREAKTFNALYVSMVRAGEASGKLESILARLAHYREKSARLRGRVKAALTYPIAVIVIATVITAGLMVFIVPKFQKVFMDILPGGRIPALTRWVIDASLVIRHQFLLIVLLLVIVGVLFRIFRKTTFGGYWIDYVLLRMPPFGGLMTKVAVARFCSTLGTLLQSGVPVMQALEIVRNTSGNAVLANSVVAVRDAVSQGTKMGQPMRDCRMFPKMVVGMIEIGEESGALPEMLARVGEVYEDEVDMAVEGLTSLIEPVVIVVLGVVIGTIVLAMFAPLTSIISELGA